MSIDRSSPLDLVRAELRGFAGYASARKSGSKGRVWLNANESPWPSPVDPGLALNRYPEPQPAALKARLAEIHGVPEESILLTRGSDEGIDLLTRALCRAGHDAVLITPPCFGMYAVCAHVQGAALVKVPLRDTDGALCIDVDAMLAAFETATGAFPVKLVFVCSPGNPGGAAALLTEIERLLAGLAGRAVLVVDEAYAEYSALPSALTLFPRFAHLVVLRTLSKAHALAGVRIGITIGDVRLVQVLAAIAPPYPLAQPAVALALKALEAPAIDETRRGVGRILFERGRLASALQQLPVVRQVYASDANYLLVRFHAVEAVFQTLLDAGVVVRDQRSQPGLADALRISIGTAEENDALLAALAASSAGIDAEQGAGRE